MPDHEGLKGDLSRVPISLGCCVRGSLVKLAGGPASAEASPRMTLQAPPLACSASCSTFESAVAAAGVDFRSDKLWELYVEWQKEQGELRAVTAIYDRVLTMPTQLYSHHWEK